MNKLILYCYLSFALLCCFITNQSLAGSEPPVESNPTNGQAANSLDVQIKAKIEAINADKSMDENTKGQLLALYRSVQGNLAMLQSSVTKTAMYEEAVKTASEKIKKYQQETAESEQKQDKAKGEDFTKISDDELGQRLVLEKGRLNALTDKVKSLEKDIAAENDRPALIIQEQINAQQELETAQKKLAAVPAAPVSKTEVDAGRLLLSTQADALKAQLKMLSAEKDSNYIRIELMKAELQSLISQQSRLQPVVEKIEALLNTRRQQEAKNLENELSQAEKTASGKHALIREAVRENSEYNRNLQDIIRKTEEYSERDKKAAAAASNIEADQKSAEKKIDLAGLSPVLGKILREQRRNLSINGRLDLETDILQKEMAATGLEQFKIEDKLKLLADIDDYLRSVIDQKVGKNLTHDQRMMIQAELRGILENQKDLLNKLSLAYTNYMRALGEFDFTNRQLLRQADKFAHFLDERLLWVPSSTPINADFAAGLYDACRWLLSPHNHFSTLKDLGVLTRENKILAFLSLAGLLLLPKFWREAKHRLKIISERTGRVYSDRFSYTITALSYTLILVLPLPLYAFSIGWLMTTDMHATNFTKAIGTGLQNIAIPLFALQFCYRTFADKGIAVQHFQWDPQTALTLRREVAWLRFVIIPCVFLIHCTGASPITGHGDSLGRLALIITMAVLTVSFARLLNPTTGLFRLYFKENPNDGFTKLRFVWSSLILLSPVTIAGFAIVGYYLSALELQQKLVLTLRLILVLVVIYGLAIRWLLLVNKKLVIKNIIQKRKAEAEKQEFEDSGEDIPLHLDEQSIDIPTVNAQSIKLLVVFVGFALILGIGMIWSNILPAFSFLDQIVLWQHSEMVDNQESYQPVTLTNLLLACLFGFILVVSVRNFSGLMELLVFSRLTVEPGVRYAVNQLTKYLIISLGFVCIADELGGSWSQVQWLVAALSVGLGFGLQEIFANMVSGIILLFERPIRVGDTVTINSVTGKVSRIQMRATTIIDLDRKELIVPNKTFITNQLVNWTLSDTTTRLQFPVVIAFGADSDLAFKLMLEAASSTPLVLDDPAPSVVFTGMKDNGLEFTISVFVSELSHRTPVRHSFNFKLEKLLREHRIDLPHHDYGAQNPLPAQG